MRAEIITICLDSEWEEALMSNAQYLRRELSGYGAEDIRQSDVRDKGQLEEALAVAGARSDCVTILGGLEDAAIRKAIFRALNFETVLHDGAQARMREYFESTGQEMSPPVEQQALLPKSCEVFSNDHGAAAGFAVAKYEQIWMMLPRRPREFVPMFNDYVAPYLESVQAPKVASRTVGVFGLTETSVSQRLADMMCQSNPLLTLYYKDEEILLRVNAYAQDRLEACAMCNAAVEEIGKRLSHNVYGVDAGSMQKAVVRLLKEKGLTAATAESCTAGLLSGRLTEVPGASEVFRCGIAAYDSEVKESVLDVKPQTIAAYGAVSAQTAGEMAVGARKVGGADIGVSITGVAGPDDSEGKPVGTVFIALADSKRLWVKQIDKVDASFDREQIRQIATSTALDLLRRYLEASPAVMAGGQLLGEAPQAQPIIPVVPEQKNIKRRFPRVLLTIGLLLVAALAVSLYSWKVLPTADIKTMKELQDIYNDTKLSAGSVFSGEYPEGMQARFFSLYGINQDIRGWVKIDGTPINYPVMQNAEEGYYAARDFNKHADAAGIPYFDNSADFSSQQAVNRALVVYGNNTGDDMFSAIEQYTNLSFLRQHPVIEFNTIYKDAKWKVCGVMIVSTLESHSNSFDYTKNQFADEIEFVSYARELQARSLYDLPVTIRGGDSLLLLSTPTDQYGFDGARVVVVARMVRAQEEETSDLSKATVNRDVIMPDVWQQMHTTTGGSGTTTSGTSSETENGSDMSSLATTTTTKPSEIPTFPMPEEPDDGFGENPTDEPPTETIKPTKPTTSTTEATTRPTTSTTTAKPTTSTAEETTSGTPPTTSTTTTQPTTSTTTTTSSTAITTTTSQPTTSTTTTTTQPSQPVETLPTISVKETEIWAKYFQVYDTSTKTLIVPQTKEELQRCLAGIVKRELGTASTMKVSMEAHKALAVATYSYILSYCSANGTAYPYALAKLDLEGSSVDAIAAQKIYEAVGEVLGVKVIYPDKPLSASMFCLTVYSASVAGETASCHKYWTQNLPYLQSVSSPYDSAEYIHTYLPSYAFESSKELTLTQFRETLQAYLDAQAGMENVFVLQWEESPGGGPLYAVESDGVTGQYIYKSNYYYLNGSKKVYLTGSQLRSIFGLRSHAIRAEYDAETDALVLQVQGHGHGVGMSQLGAVGYANHGWNYQQILKHYYSITDTSPYQLIGGNWDE